MFNIFAPKKPFNAQINSAATTLLVPAGDNLLNAALRSGIPWPHNCRVGSCGTCRCRLLNGKIKPLNDFSYVLNEDDLDAGMILACQTRLRSDIEIEVRLDENAIDLAEAKTVQGVITGSLPLTHDILEIHIQLDQALPAYVAGQYAEISVEGIEQARSYSFACAPFLEQPNHVTFYVRHVPGGEMSSWLHSESRIGTPVTVNGPHGTFYLRDTTAPILCIAGGSGLAPIKALLEQLAGDGFKRQTTFLFGARGQRDLYGIEQMNQLTSQYPQQFRFVPVLSDEPQDSDWHGARGLVTEFIDAQQLDLPACQAYLCGPPPMIDSAIKVLTEAGLAEEQIFFDKFLDASHLPGGKR